MGAENVQGPQFSEQRMSGRKVKRRFEQSLFFPGSDLLGRTSSAYEKGDGIDEEGFAGTGFTGEHRKSGLKLNVKLLDQGKINNAQLGKHRSESGAIQPKALTLQSAMRERRSGQGASRRAGAGRVR